LGLVNTGKTGRRVEDGRRGKPNMEKSGRRP